MEEQLQDDRWVNWCTLYTDASGTGGWAVWARHSKPPLRIKASGAYDSSDAVLLELYAIYQGVLLIKETWADIEGIGVRCDCQPAIALANEANKPDGKLHRRADLRQMQLDIRDTLGQTHLKCKWVKGHQGTATTQGWLNNWCDKNARRG